MPRKAKEKMEELNSTMIEEKSAKAVTKTVKSTKIKSNSDKAKKEAVASKTTAKIKEKSTKKDAASKTTKNKSTKKATTSTKTTTSKLKKKIASKTTSTLGDFTPVSTTEYYDLPFRYNQTVVKILAQTPNILFIYWDIADIDRNAYTEKYGQNFFEITKPYLTITNETMHYSFEVEINDFANSWYLHINDANCEYKVELIRKFVANSDHTVANKTTYHVNDTVFVTSSNGIEMPNDHILFDRLGGSVFFRNTKTNVTEEKNISSLSFLQKLGKVYHIYDLYKEIYKDELSEDGFSLDLPSSSSSSF